MKKLTLLFGIVLVLITCSLEDEELSGGESQVTVITPFQVNPPLFNIIDAGTGDKVNTSGLSQDRFRFEIIIESEGRRIKYYFLSTNEVVSLTIPSGIPLSFYVGLYYAVSSSSNEEEYNVYIASDSKEDIVFMAGETKELYFTLDLTKSLKVNTYFDSTYGSNNYGQITGGVIGDDNLAHFSIYPLSTSTSATTTIIRTYNGTSFAASPMTLTGNAIDGKGGLYHIEDTPAADNLAYWYIQSTGIHRSNDTNGAYSDGTTPGTASVRSYLPNVESCNVVSFNSNTDFYYMLSYGQGYLAFDYGATGAAWSGAGVVDFSYASSTYSNEHFLLDMAQDTYNDDYAFFATKIGLFYVYKTTMGKLAVESTRDEGISDIRKLIRVNALDSGYSTLITRVVVVNNKVYLGTRRGLYFISQTTGAWHSFADHNNSSYMIFSNEDIETVDEFTYYNEPIVSMAEENNILMVATNRRVWFKNLSNGKTDMITVWDGIPFVPLTSYKNEPDVNPIDFTTHQVAPIKFVLWDDSNSVYWIGTDYGLCSVNRSSLSL